MLFSPPAEVNFHGNSFGCSFRGKNKATSIPSAKPISVVAISRMARGMVMLKKRTLVSTCAVFCKMIMMPSNVNTAMLIILKRFMLAPSNFCLRYYIQPRSLSENSESTAKSRESA